MDLLVNHGTKTRDVAFSLIEVVQRSRRAGQRL